MKEPNYITPNTILRIFQDIRKSVTLLGARKIDQKELYNKLNEILNKDLVSFLILYGDTITNEKIIDEVLQSCKPLTSSHVESLSKKLILLAGADKETIQKISSYTKQKKYKSYFNKYKLIVALGVLIILFFIRYYPGDEALIPDSPHMGSYADDTIGVSQPSSQKYVTIDSGNSNPVINNSSSTDLKSFLAANEVSEWKIKEYKTGSSPGCFKYTPKYNKALNNRLEISVGSNTEVVIKLIDIKTNKCIRYVYIRSGDSYKIRNIPEGRYYLKIAYGKDWRQRIENGKCAEKFMKNAFFKKGEDILDFNKIYAGTTPNGNYHYKNYQLPSYSLELDVIATSLENGFNTDNISESEFDDQD